MESCYFFFVFANGSELVAADLTKTKQIWNSKIKLLSLQRDKNSEISKMSEWADLPCDVFFQIMCRLCSDDTIISSAVCKSWHLLLKSVEKLPLPPSCPWLMLAEESKQSEKINDEESRTRGFFNLRNAKVHYFKLPEVAGRRCFGASFGWLLTIGTDLQINLLHPFSKYLLCLPPIATFCCQYEFKVTPERLRRMFLKKVVLSRSPWNPATRECDCDWVVMVIYGEYQQLAFTRPGYKAWVDITNTQKRYADIAFYKEEINLKIQIHIQKYIVESSGDLLFVTRFRGGKFYSRLNDYSYEEDSDSDTDSGSESSDEDSEDDFENEDPENVVEDEDSENAVEDEDSKDESDEEGFAKNDNPYVTIGFTVHKLTRCTQEGSIFKYKWVKVDSLGDQALFVGNSSSLSLTASSLNGIKPNCIYFTDDDLFHFTCTRNGGGFDMGVYRMEDAIIMPHYSGQSLSFLCSPLCARIRICKTTGCYIAGPIYGYSP
ncbi:hypothetical protein CMV_019154 [Castanea mollissima]|uniref:F-box domain-containing protein n=1 Tax=Castanea mollissima TaxID=60419 RepID=A0A8J4QQC0_9ROSI|nr:hypothetical protein CMV_019154 [Castanea mollissima]